MYIYWAVQTETPHEYKSSVTGISVSSLIAGS
jgi:hypothetical protein